jgi:hypothetical protein
MSSTTENEIAQLEMKDLCDWKCRITVTKLPYALKRQTELTNEINRINEKQLIAVEELMNLEEKGFHGSDAILYAYQYNAGRLRGLSNQTLQRAMRIVHTPPPISTSMSTADVRCRERWLNLRNLQLQEKKEKLIEHLEEVRSTQTGLITTLWQIVNRIQNKEDEDEEDQSEEDEDEEDQSKKGQDEMQSDEDNIADKN